MQKIVFTGGGSAGHVLPNVAIIEALKQTGAYDLYYFGTSGIERSIIAPLHHSLFICSQVKYIWFVSFWGCYE